MRAVETTHYGGGQNTLKLLKIRLRPVGFYVQPKVFHVIFKVFQVLAQRMLSKFQSILSVGPTYFK